MKMLQRIGTVLTIVGLVLWCTVGLVCSVSAEGEKGSLKLLCRTADEQALVGMHWDIYAVGGRVGADKLELRGDFADFPVSLADTTAMGLSAAAQTLENFAVLNHITPLDSQEADQSGTLSFDSLDQGLYLVAGEMLRQGDIYYIPTPFLVEIPVDGSVVDFSAHPKYLSVDATKESWEYSVKKIWANTDAQPEEHSDFVMVQIYRNGVLVNTVELNESNDWSYAWTAKEFYDWRVLEIKVSEKYYVVYRSNETQYVIVNTYNNDYQNEVTHTTNVVEQTTTTATTVSDQFETSLTSEGTGVQTSVGTQTVPSETTVSTTVQISEDNEKLPQTGQLWWPVPILGTSGLLLIAIGLRLRTKE